MQGGQPYLVQVIGSDMTHVPLFSSKAALDLAKEEGLVAWDRIVQVNDPVEFLASIPSSIFIAFDLHRSDRGTVLYRVLDPKHPEWVEHGGEP